MIVKEGLPFILSGFAVGAAGIAAARLTQYQLPGYILGGLALLFGLFCCYFFRNPDRATPNDQNTVFSPADGTVISVKTEEGNEGQTVRIFMSVFNVHVQRMPVSGTIREIEYIPGTFAIANKEIANANERNIVRIKPDRREGVLGVEQIAGLLARRIRCWVEEGDSLKAGERYGLIQFGSQVAVHLPMGVEPVVKVGQKTVGGITPLGKWTERR